MVTGDLEAQDQHHPDWYLKHKHWLRANQEEEENKLGYFIRKVPEYHRQPSSDFTPLGRFGLHNRENLDPTGLEEVKLSVAVEFGLVGEKWEAFCDAVVEDPESMLTCYGLQQGATSWKHEEIKHVLALDALFLAVYCDLDYPQNERRFRTPTVMSLRYGEWSGIVPNDLFRAENQIPFVLIQKAIEYLSSDSPASEASEDTGRDIKYLEKFLNYAVNGGTEIFMKISGESFKTENARPLENRQHFLGAAYEVVCGREGLFRKTDGGPQYINILSATDLKVSGIRIIGVNGPLCTMAYNNKCLFLPKMSIYDETASFVRNMAWYERTTFVEQGCMFHDYVLLMLDLIESPADLKVLSNCGVIQNGCGINAFEKWKALKDGLTQVPSSKEHHAMKLAINKRCAFRRYRFWSEFRILFCSRPWLVLSTCAVFLVTVATLIQTYVAVTGSNRMKPKFP